MRQAGYLAAAGIYALDNNINRLKEDHQKAQQLADVLSNCSWVETVYPVETNILLFRLPEKLMASEWVEKLAQKEIYCLAIGPDLQVEGGLQYQ